VAPAKASSPPTIHSPNIAAGAGAKDAITAGVVKIPTPITLETTSAVPSASPSRSRKRTRTPRLLDTASNVPILADFGGMSQLPSRAQIKRAAAHRKDQHVVSPPK